MKKTFPAHKQMRAAMTAEILGAVRDGCVSKREIQSRTSFSWGNVSVNVNRFLDAGILEPAEEAAEEERGAGRQTQRFAFSPKKYLTAGIEIRPDRVLCSLADLSGKELLLYEHTAERPLKEDEILPAAREAWMGALKKAGLKPASTAAVSFALTGAVDSENMRWIKTPKISSVRNLDFKKASGFFPGINLIKIEHDTTALAKAVTKNIPGAPDDYVFLFISDGLGMAARQKGGFVAGSRGLACEAGHIPCQLFPGKTLRCDCGNDNCLELFLSSKGVAGYIRDNISSVPPAPKYERLTGSLSQKQKDGICGYLRPLLTLLSVLACNIFDPETLLIGGDAVEFCLGELEEGFGKDLKSRTWQSSPSKVVFYRMDGHSAAFGATIGMEKEIIRQIADPQ
jgi:predicted NBD/HSP70 family sugar kinase